MLLFRSLVFNILFYFHTALMTFAAIGGHLFGRRYTLKVAYAWGVGTHFLLKWIVGLTFEIRGRQNWDGSPAIFACKHQSLLETTMIQVLAFDSCIILKRELLWIPFFGQALTALEVVGIKRSRGRQSLEELVKKAKACLATGRNFMIFPEGTRTAPGQVTKLKYGVAALYEATNKPVIPIVLNTGYFWPRRSFLRYPGKVIYQYLEPIQPGLSPETFLTHLNEVMEQGCRNLDKETQESLNKKRPFRWQIALTVCACLIGTGFYAVQRAKETLGQAVHILKEDALQRGIAFNFSKIEQGFNGATYEIALYDPCLRLCSLPWLSWKAREKLILKKNIFSLSPQVNFTTTGPSLVTSDSFDQPLLTLGSFHGSWAPQATTLHIHGLEGKGVYLEQMTYHTYFSPPASTWKHDLTAQNFQGPLLVIPLSQLHMAFHLIENSPPLDLAALKAWAQAGGLIEIEDLSLVVPPFKAALKGSLGIDEAMQPIGSFTLKTTGAEKGLEIMHAAKIIPAWAVTLLKLSLKGFKSHEADKHGLSLTLQEGQVYLEGVPVTSLVKLKEYTLP